MFKKLAGAVPNDRDYPARAWTLAVRRAVLQSKIFDSLKYGFQEEKSQSGEYIPIRDRRPSVRYNLCKVVVHDSVSLLFDDSHFPEVDAEDENSQDKLRAVIKESKLHEAMTEAAIRGSVGSICIWMRILDNRVFFQVFDTDFLTPVWDPTKPDQLLKIIERYKVTGIDLINQGYSGIDRAKKYWFQRDWNAENETWYLPWPIADKEAVAKPDIERTINHGLGFVPMVWVKNLPGGDGCDGACTFEDAIESSIEIVYQLSQAGRGLKYSSDPQLVISGDVGDGDGPVTKASTALILGEEADAKLLEINGTAAAAVIDYVKFLRELALESVHGNRSDASKMSAAQSGRSMELMNQALIWLTGKLRTSYGEGALLALMRMVVLASNKFALQVNGEAVGKLDASKRVSLKWPPWYAPTATDVQALASATKALGDAGQISRETAVKSIASTFDIEDVPAELKRIEADKKLLNEQLPPNKIQVTENI